MGSPRTPPARCIGTRARVAALPRARARVARWLAPERGDTLIEVMVAAVMVALVAGATLTGYAQVAHMTSTQRHRVEADSLAELDQARLRGLTITQLSGSQGNRSVSETVDGTSYTITSMSQYVSGTSAVMSCTTGPTVTTADEVQITSTVTWSPGNDKRLPVIVHGLVTPAEGGSLVITATDPSGAGLSGVTATPSGPTTVSALATDANGCAIFGGLAGGSYTVGFADPGYVDVNGNANPSQTKTVIPTETAGPVNEQMGQAATINATFSTKWTASTVAATSDQIVATQNLMTPAFRLFGTDSTASNSTFSA
jgi:Tfp pilus assembly protein PilE